MLTFLPALVVLAAVSASPAASAELPIVVEGKLASVALLQAQRIAPEDLKACCPGAAAGLKLVLLFRPIDAPVDVTLSPQVETLIDRQPYLANASGEQGPRPKLDVRNVEPLFQQFPDLAARVPKDFKPHLGLIVTVPGDALPEAGQVHFAMKLGYHKRLEPFAFDFALPRESGRKTGRLPEPPAPPTATPHPRLATPSPRIAQRNPRLR